MQAPFTTPIFPSRDWARRPRTCQGPGGECSRCPERAPPCWEIIVAARASFASRKAFRARDRADRLGLASAWGAWVVLDVSPRRYSQLLQDDGSVGACVQWIKVTCWGPIIACLLRPVRRARDVRYCCHGRASRSFEVRTACCVCCFSLFCQTQPAWARPARCGDCETWVRRGSRPSRSLHGEESMAVESRWRMISARGGGEEFSPPVARGELKPQEGQEGLRKSDRIWTAGHEGRFNLACPNWLPVGSGWAGLGGRQ